MSEADLEDRIVDYLEEYLGSMSKAVIIEIRGSTSRIREALETGSVALRQVQGALVGDYGP